MPPATTSSANNNNNNSSNNNNGSTFSTANSPSASAATAAHTNNNNNNTSNSNNRSTSMSAAAAARNDEMAYFNAIAARDVDAIKNLNATRRFLHDACHAPGYYGRQPLHVCVWDDWLEGAKLLLDAGADINAHDDLYDTPFLIACAENRKDILEYMLKAAKQVRKFQANNEKRLKASVPDYTVLDRNGSGCLQVACERGHVAVVEMLVREIEAANSSQNNNNNNNAVSSAPDVNALNDYQLNPLLGVLAKGGDDRDHVTIVKMLITRAGADVNACGEQGRRPLQIARELGYRRIAQLLEQAGGRDFPGVRPSPSRRSFAAGGSGSAAAPGAAATSPSASGAAASGGSATPAR